VQAWRPEAARVSDLGMTYRKGEITRERSQAQVPHIVCAASCNVGLPTRYRKKVLLTMGFAL
jgi:hypothetical protein